MTLAASTDPLGRYCPLCLTLRAGCAGLAAALFVIEVQVLNLFHMFSPSMTGKPPTMASADFYSPILLSLDNGSQWQESRPPRVRRVTCPLIPAASTSAVSVQVSGFGDMRLLTHCDRLLCDSCSSGQWFACGFLQIPPRNGHPCRSANRSPYRADSGFAPPSHPATTTTRLPKGTGCFARVVKPVNTGDCQSPGLCSTLYMPYGFEARPGQPEVIPVSYMDWGLSMGFLYCFGIDNRHS